MTTTALETTVQPVNQALADYKELRKLSEESWQQQYNVTRKAKEKEAAARAKWFHDVKRAVSLAAELVDNRDEAWHLLNQELSRAVFQDERKGPDDNWSGSWGWVSAFSHGLGEDDAEEKSLAFGFGMVCGMMYAQITGLQLPIPVLPEESAPEAPQSA